MQKPNEFYVSITFNSDNLERSFPACLTLSYVIDKEKEIDFIADEKVTILNITRWLMKCFKEGQQSFSVGELVEALENLSIHPKNSENINLIVVPIMFDILDKYDKSENDVIRRYLSTMDLYKEDDKTTAGGKGNTQELDKTLEATCVDETARETCALVKNLLCNFAEMTAKEIKDALDVINKIIMETSKERRMVIAERIAGVDGFLESLMNLALNFYGNGDEDLYFDELRWQNLNSVNSIFWNCADASIQFASAAGDAGLVKFLLHICQQHREKLKDKNTILLDLISEFYGGLPENLKPLLDKSQMTELQEEEVRDNTDDTERRTQFDCPICSAQASEDQDHLHFLAVSDRSA
ncbi:uncharacterized protein [Ptychodera flava]|uniref:uncharacterized protein n=1 Tax=Ptychodera flava TaxID=63121 RepID=UPI00396A7648